MAKNVCNRQECCQNAGSFLICGLPESGVHATCVNFQFNGKSTKKIDIVHILRNPHGYSDETVRAARRRAADFIEEIRKVSKEI